MFALLEQFLRWFRRRRLRPVSQAIQIEDQAADTVIRSLRIAPLHAALGAIDAVHTDGALPRLKARRAKLANLKGEFVYHGLFTYHASGAVQIDVCEVTPYPEFIMLHEVGHFLDRHGIGAPTNWASHRHPILAPWREAVKESEAVQRLGALAKSGATQATQTLPDGRSFTYRVRQAYVRYLLQPHELWARSYAQYITEQSRDPLLRQQLTQWQERNPDKFYYGIQWDADDFLPIQEALEAAFHELGWSD